jgi:hypothetical protein
MDVLSRFIAFVEPEPNTGCWLWSGSGTEAGYGQISVNGRATMAYRWSYEHFRGPIAPGLEPDHLCRVRCCVNPAHLELVTHRENTLRGQTLAAMNAAKTHCRRGHPYSGDNLRSGMRGKQPVRVCRQCAKENKLAFDERRRSA